MTRLFDQKYVSLHIGQSKTMSLIHIKIPIKLQIIGLNELDHRIIYMRNILLNKKLRHEVFLKNIVTRT